VEAGLAGGSSVLGLLATGVAEELALLAGRLTFDLMTSLSLFRSPYRFELALP